MIDQLPEDLLYFIAEKINSVSIINKFRLLSSTLYYLTEKVKFNSIVLNIDFDNYTRHRYESFNVVVKVNQEQLNNNDLSLFYDIYGIYGLNITDISRLYECKILKYLSLNLTLDFSNVEGIIILQHCTELRYLDLRCIFIRDIDTLQYCTKLQHLDLSCTSITSIDPLQHCTILEYLDLSYTKITDIDALKYCTNLCRLSLEFTTITNIDALQYCTILGYLHIGHTYITDVTSLKYCTMLKKLYLTNNIYTECLSHIANLIIFIRL